jgi:hypothetical protein
MSEQRPVLSVFNQSNNDLGSGLLSAPNEGSNSISRMSSLASNALSRQNSTQSDYSYADYSDDETGEIDENMPTVIPCNREKKGFAGPKIDFNRPYTVSPESVIDLIAQDVNIIAEFCCIPTPLALMVLYTFGFDKDLVQSKFMEADDGGDALIQHLKINRIPSEYTVESVPEWGCMICQEEENVEFLSFGCGHVFCKNCYTRYCTEKLNGNDVFNIRCMQPGCNIMPSKDTLKQLLGDSTGKEYEDGATAEGATAETEVTSKGSTSFS